MNTISLALIIKDVEKTIDRCLSDFSKVADEIVVVDTGSTDNSLEIVRKYTDNIYHFEWIDDFSAARNFSFSKCTKDFILWCCHPETLIHSEKGLIPISKISIGDKVLTHRGIYKSVTKVYIQDYDGEIHCIKSPFSEEDIKVTPNHEFLSTTEVKCKTGVKFCTPNCKKQWSKRNLKKKGKLTRQCKQLYQEYDFKFNPVESLRVNDVVAYPRRKQTIFKPFFINIGDSFNCKHRFSTQMELTPEFMRLIGYYVAEGTSGKGYCSFCFHRNEIRYHDDVLYLMKKIFNMEGKKYLNGNRCNITFTSTVIAKFFYNVLNGLQPTRSLPDKWLDLSDEHLIEFLKSYYRGDGDDCSDSFRMTTTSFKLVYQVREILSRFGICPNITPYKTKKKDAWKICIGGEKKREFEQIISEKHSKQYSYLNRNKFYYSDADYIYSPISKKETEHYKGKVYNLEVEDDHTYVTDHLVCHNCDGDDYAYPDDLKKIREIDYSDKEIILIDYIYSHDEFGNDKLVVPRERIIKRSLNLKWEGEIHEIIPLSGGKNWKAEGIKTHHNKQHGTSERNLAILERVVAKNPSARKVFYLAREYFDFGKYDDSIKYLEEFLNEYKGVYWEDLYLAHYKMALCYMHKDDEAKFKECMFESIKIEDRWAEPYCYLGLYYMNKQQWDKAIQWYEIATKIRRPKELMTSYQPEYYTWLPNLNLCVCYNAIGEIERAYECNSRVLEYRPKDSRAVKNEQILSAAIKRKRGYEDGKGKKINVGSGERKIENYLNVDVYEAPGIDVVSEMDDLPYEDSTISEIYSEHALEHVPFKRAEKTLKEWFRVLQPGGKLILHMPDFELCCQSYLKAPLEDSHFMNTRAWFKYTIYGIQESQGGEPDDAQIHQCGFSKEEIKIVVEKAGFQVTSVENYGGPGQKPDYGTPSMTILAIKPGVVENSKEIIKVNQKVLKEEINKPKVGWISTENWVAAQTRIRVLRINDWLKNQGYESSVISFDQADNYDVIIIGKKFDEDTYNNVKKLKGHKKIYCDLCESLFEFAWVEEILKLCDLVICCSNTLAEQVKRVNQNVTVIEDAYEIA